MFTVNEDLSIYVTRGDAVYFGVTAADDKGENYKFQPGDLVRIKVYEKKKATNVVLQKDFPVTSETETVEIYLTEEDTKIGKVINKPVDYWYEVELNPLSVPQTIVGYNEDGAAIFKLFPEGADIGEEIDEGEKPIIPIMDNKLDLSSTRAVENQAIARAIAQINGVIRNNKDEATKRADIADKMAAELSNKIGLEKARIDNLTSGATAGDEELIDMRVGADGTIFATAGAATRKQGEFIERLTKDTIGVIERATVWENRNLNGNVVNNRIRTQLCTAKGMVTINAPESFRFALGVYNADGTLVFDSDWKEGNYVSEYGEGALYRVLLAKKDDSDIDTSYGNSVIISEHFNTRHHSARIKSLENDLNDIESRFTGTRNLFTGGGDWENADINGKKGGILEPKYNNSEYAAVNTYMPIKAGKHVLSWSGVNDNIINIYLHFSDSEKNYIEYTALYNVSGKGYKTFTAPQNAAFYRLSIYSTTSEKWEDIIPNDLQVEEGEAPTTYIGARVIRAEYIDTDIITKKIPQKTITSATIRSIAHRGEPTTAPQCTEHAYFVAKRLGFNIAENDLFISADGALVMWHDTTLARLGYNLKDINGYDMYTDGNSIYYYNPATSVLFTYGESGYEESGVNIIFLSPMKGADYSVTDLPLDVLKRIDFGAYMDEKYKGTQILTFAEWVRLCKWLGLEIYIDKKISLTEAIVSEMAYVVKRYGMLNHTTWFCWDMNEANWIRKEIPNARLVFLDAPTASKIESRKVLLNGGSVVFNPHTLELTEENTAAALAAGYEVECWNVDYNNYGLNTEEAIFAEIMRVCCLGVSGVTLDKYSVEDVILKHI